MAKSYPVRIITQRATLFQIELIMKHTILNQLFCGSIKVEAIAF